MFKAARSTGTLGVLLAIAAAPVLAHRPIFSDKSAVDPQNAVVIAEPDISQVIYRPLSKEAPRLWLTFEVKQGFELFIQIGVPKIKGLSNFRPAIAVIGPGLPTVALPFPIPQKTGGRIFPTEHVAKPRVFHEHFTRTDSWILRSETLRLPQSGRYYVVAFSPAKQRGKIWLAVGRRESFGLADLLRFPSWSERIRAFHEVAPMIEKKSVYGDSQDLLVDDFARTDGISSLGTRWNTIIDRVMGGLSTAQSTHEKIEGTPCLRLSGTVSLENNGGFIQARLPMGKEDAFFNAEKYRGIRIRVKGNGKSYSIHLRTSQTTLPWQYYAAEFSTTEQFRSIEIPFQQFKPQNLTLKLDPKILQHIAVVAAKEAFQADVWIASIEFYR